MGSEAGAMMSPRISTESFIEPSQLAAGLGAGGMILAIGSPRRVIRIGSRVWATRSSTARHVALNFEICIRSMSRDYHGQVSWLTFPRPAGRTERTGWRSPQGFGLAAGRPAEVHAEEDEERTPGDFDGFGSEINPLAAGSRDVEFASHFPTGGGLARSAEHHVNPRPDEEPSGPHGDSRGCREHERGSAGLLFVERNTARKTLL